MNNSRMIACSALLCAVCEAMDLLLDVGNRPSGLSLGAGATMLGSAVTLIFFGFIDVLVDFSENKGRANTVGSAGRKAQTRQRDDAA